MPTRFSVSIALTDAALQLIYATHADLLRTPPSSVVGRIYSQGGVGRLRPQDANQVRAQGAYLRMVSVVEAYIDALSSHSFDLRVDRHDQLVRLLVAAAEAGADGTWELRKSAFESYHGVSLGSCKGWHAVDASHAVRNAIAHGLGSLTRRQRDQKTRSKVRNAGVVLVDDALWITDLSLVRCRDSSATFVRDVDEKVRVQLRLKARP